MLSLLPLNKSSSNRLKVNKYSEYDPIISTRRDSMTIEEEIGESEGSLSSESSMFLGIEPKPSSPNHHHFDPSTHGSFPADVEEEIITEEGGEVASDEEHSSSSRCNSRFEHNGDSFEPQMISANLPLLAHELLQTSFKTISSTTTTNDEDSIENTPKKKQSFKKRFAVPVNQPVFSPRKDRLVKHFSEFYFHPESSQYSTDGSQIVSPKEYNSFLSRHVDDFSPVSTKEGSLKFLKNSNISAYTTWSSIEGGESFSPPCSTSSDIIKNSKDTTSSTTTKVLRNNISPPKPAQQQSEQQSEQQFLTTTTTSSPAAGTSQLPPVSFTNSSFQHLTERQKNLLYSIKVAKVVKESNNNSIINNCNGCLIKESKTIVSSGNSKSVEKSKKSSSRIKEEVIAKLSSPLKRKLKKEEYFDSTVQPLTSFRSEEGREVSAVEEWIAFQKQRITEDDIEDTTEQDNNNNFNNEEGGIFEFTQVTEAPQSLEENMTSGNSISPPFHLIKRSSNKTMQLISSDIPIVHHASSTALFANIPPILKPLQLSQASSAQLEKKQHQQVRNSLQQFQTSNKHHLHTVPKPTVSKSQIVPPSAKTASRPMMPNQTTPVVPNQHEELKPVRRKNAPTINVPQIKINDKLQTYASMHQLKSPSNHKQQEYELAADSVFVVVSGDVLNDIREKNEKVERKKSWEIIYFDKSLSRVKQVVPCGAFTIFVVEGKEYERVFVIYKENPLLHPTKKVENVYNKFFNFCNTNFHPQLREVDYKTLIRTEMNKGSTNLDPYVLQDPKSFELNEIYGTQDAFMLKMRNNFCIFVHFAETAEKVKISFFEEYAGGTIDWIETNPCSNTLLLYGHARGRTNYLLDIMILDPEPRRRKLQLPPEISQNNIRIIRVGLHRIIIVTNDNQLYVHRSEKKGSETSENFELFDKVWEAPIRQVRCGGYHNVVLLQNGNIYAWGFNNHYQCGIYENVKNKIPIVPLTFINLPKSLDGEITDIQASYLTTSVITTNGVWTIGDMTAKINNYVKSTDGLRYHIIPFAKFNFLLNAMWSAGDHLVLFNHSENHEGIQGYFSKNLSKMLHIESEEKNKRSVN